MIYIVVVWPINVVAEGIKMANDLKSDIIFFTGDLVNDMSSEVEGFKELFSSLKAPLGVMSVTGNHDYGDYVNWKSKKKNIRILKI